MRVGRLVIYPCQSLPDDTVGLCSQIVCVEEPDGPVPINPNPVIDVNLTVLAEIARRSGADLSPNEAVTRMLDNLSDK